ncbi:MAG: hypothetical protein VXW22_04955, partial [Pseudomonadota bacterium]|nr:hypothetical protein [Pseudomonadota bacterium]
MHKLLATFLLAGMLSVSGCERAAVDASDADATADAVDAREKWRMAPRRLREEAEDDWELTRATALWRGRRRA